MKKSENKKVNTDSVLNYKPNPVYKNLSKGLVKSVETFL